MLKFALIGDGQVAKYHRKAIEYVGGEICWVVDPKHGHDSNKLSEMISDIISNNIDYYVICSPSQWHYPQIKTLLSSLNSSWKEFQIICEKPAFLPWENVIDDDRINIVLQLRYLPNLPERAEKVVAHFVRDDAYFKSWKGDPKKTGGLFYSLFIHFLDLAIQLGADFEGSINFCGNHRTILFDYGELKNDIEIRNFIDINSSQMQLCYNRMYEAVLNGNGIKPKDIFYLNWVLTRNSELFGYGRDAIGKTIKIGKELL